MSKKETAYTIEPDFYLPRFSDPYRNLLAEILSRAIRDYIIENKEFGSEQHKKDAKRWLCIQSNDPFPNEEFSYAWICDHLNLDPWELRERIVILQKTPTKSFFDFLVRLPNTSF